MATIEKILDPKIRLIISLEEARWLKSIMQNPLFGQHIKHENIYDKEKRTKFWEILQKIE